MFAIKPLNGDDLIGDGQWDMHGTFGKGSISSSDEFTGIY
jgi:hypothetical protein